MSSALETKSRPSLSVLALAVFIVSFLIARAFTTISPDTVLVGGGLHIHHFWFGLIMLAVGGWLGISYNDVRIDRFAAVLFGAGGGLIVDEIGLLLTLESESYFARTTYTFLIIFVAFASMLILINRYRKVIRAEFVGFLGRSASFYFGIFLAAISIAFMVETSSTVIFTVAAVLALASFVLILSYLVRRLRTPH